jgi:HK97 family phage prohead protease
MQAECRTQALEVRDLETNGSLTRMSGIAVPYSTMTDIGPFYESFERGAFAKSINESARALPLMLEHGGPRGLPIGSAESWSDDVDGLRGVWRFTDSEAAQEAARAVKDGVLNFMSVRFMPNIGRIRESSVRVRTMAGDMIEKRHLTHLEARLLETSLVSAPAYAGATVEWVRSALAGDEPFVQMSPESKPTRRYLEEWRDELARLR